MIHEAGGAVQRPEPESTRFPAEYSSRGSGALRMAHEMAEEPQATVPDSSTAAGWQQALDDLERSLRQAVHPLTPLHRALLAFVPVENISLLSFANGVPVISLRSQGELNLDRLGAAVSAGMDRECEVIPQDNGRVYLRLQARPGQEA